MYGGAMVAGQKESRRKTKAQPREQNAEEKEIDKNRSFREKLTQYVKRQLNPPPDRDEDLTGLNDEPQLRSVVFNTRAVEPPAFEQPAVDPPAFDPLASDPPAVEPPAFESQTLQPPVNAQEACVPEGIATTTVQPELDSIALEILGVDPNIEIKYGKDINKDLAIRLEHTVVTGLSKEARKELASKYLTPANCTIIDPPALNAEIKAASSELVIKRDKAIEFKQKQLAAAISCLGEAISRLLACKDKDPELLKLLMDASRIICDCQHTDSNTRRNFMLSSLKNDMKTQLQNTKIDKFLFGENLQETIKLAKVINKSGIELKSTAGPSKTPPVQTGKSLQPGRNKNNHLNWKGPHPGRRSTGAPRTREPAADQSTPSARASASTQRQRGSYRSSRNRHDTYRR